MNKKEEYQDERWKERAAHIRALDNHRCAMCGAKGVELHVHHLSYPPPPFHLWDATDEELVTLCKECHAKIHQSIKRPKLNESRELIGIEIKKEKGDCLQCQYCVQSFMLENWEKDLFYVDGFCQMVRGSNCFFKEVITCKTCNFMKSCKMQEDSLACKKYREWTCLSCIHFELTSEDSFDGRCNWSNKDAFAGDSYIDCSCKGEHFECVASNNDELNEYLKQFD